MSSSAADSSQSKSTASASTSSQPHRKPSATAAFSASNRSTWSAEEAEFKLDLDAITVDKWTHEQRKALLFLIACCLPTLYNRARTAAIRTSRHIPLPAIQETKSDGGAWEEEYLQGIATVLKLEPQAVEVSAHSAHARHSASSVFAGECA